MSISAPRRRFRRSKNHRPLMTEINVTPFVDVMLALLIVFMVAAPLLVTGAEVNLPRAKAESLKRTQDPIIVIIDQKGRVRVNNEKLALSALDKKLRAMGKAAQSRPVFIQANRELRYETVMRAIASISRAGFKNASLATVDP